MELESKFESILLYFRCQFSLKNDQINTGMHLINMHWNRKLNYFEKLPIKIQLKLLME